MKIKLKQYTLFPLMHLPALFGHANATPFSMKIGVSSTFTNFRVVIVYKDFKFDVIYVMSPLLSFHIFHSHAHFGHNCVRNSILYQSYVE